MIIIIELLHSALSVTFLFKLPRRARICMGVMQEVIEYSACMKLKSARKQAYGHSFVSLGRICERFMVNDVVNVL
jgi:hypothetical protein